MVLKAPWNECKSVGMRAQPVDPDSLPLDTVWQRLRVAPEPATPWRSDVVREITNRLVAAAPPALRAYARSEIRDGERYSLVPDVMVAPRSVRDERRPFVAPEQVLLVVEVDSPGSDEPYAALGIPALWRVDSDAIINEYRLTSDGGVTLAQRVAHGTFTTDIPFPVRIDLDVFR